MESQAKIMWQEKIRTYERGYAEINLDAILENMAQMKAHMAADARIMAVIKADGYGHGSVPVARTLESLDYLYGFAVATVEEAHILRTAGVRKPILVLGYTFPYSYDMLAREDIRTAVFREDSIEQLAAAAERCGRQIKVHIKVDTGMGRIGITPDEKGIAFVRRLTEEKHIDIEGIFTHFAKADEADKSHAREQLSRFRNFVLSVERELGLSIPIKHCSNSAGIMELPEANMDMTRAGIILYGLYPSDEVRRESLPLRPALSLYSHIVYIKTLHAGQSVSYGGMFTAEADTRVATVPLGYADGYPRSLSGRGYVLIRGKKAPVLGRVCMDQFMVDVTEIPEASEGDRVTLLGWDGDEHISAELLGGLSGRFNYELVCDLNQRLPRVYMREGKPVCVKDYYDNYK